MGAIRYKMRIKANEDVYAETRQRIKAVEEERKQDWWVNMFFECSLN